MKNERSILVSALIGIVWWGMVVLTAYLFATADIDKWYLVFSGIIFVVIFTVFMTFALVEKKKLREANLIKILKLAFSNIPGLNWLKKPTD